MITDSLPKSSKIIIPDKLRKALQEIQKLQSSYRA